MKFCNYFIKKGTAELLIARELAQNNGEFKEKSFMLEIKNARDMKVGFLRTVLNGIQIESTRNEANSTVDSTGTDFFRLIFSRKL